MLNASSARDFFPDLSSRQGQALPSNPMEVEPIDTGCSRIAVSSGFEGA